MKILSTIGYALAILFVGSVAVLLGLSALPIPGHLELKIVKSGSMEPFIHVGSVVAVLPAESYAVGDVVTFGRDTATQVPTTHRIVSMRTEDGHTYITTKGDANEDPDTEETDASLIIGRVLFSIPFAGYVLAFSKEPLGFMLLIGLPAALIVLSELLSIWREVTGKRAPAALRPPRKPAPARRAAEPPPPPPVREAYPPVLDLRRPGARPSP